MIEIKRPWSWTHLQSLLFDDPWPTRAGEFHSNMVHRGMCVSTWSLDSTLLRRDWSMSSVICFGIFEVCRNTAESDFESVGLASPGPTSRLAHSTP
jgi:hypothetical protein